MARIDVMMPQMGESIAEGTMSKWLKQVGDAVKRDEPIYEISTDKLDAEIARLEQSHGMLRAREPPPPLRLPATSATPAPLTAPAIRDDDRDR